VIHKGIDEGALVEAAERASGRFERLKLYYMVGLPTEMEEDIEALVRLSLQAQARFSGKVSVNITPFVPKAHTSFQWAAMASEDQLEKRVGFIERELRPEGIEVRSESPAWSAIQGVLSRGDERVGQALVRLRSATRRGWRQACRETGLDAEQYHRPRPLDAPLPWDFIDVGLDPSYPRLGMASSRPNVAQSPEGASDP
jgi:radical SAM superfamily enzyme YgiQ (UPF0313 family)